MRVAKYISSELNQNRDTQDKQHQYTIYKEGGPGFTRYIVYMDNKASTDNNVINNVNIDNMSHEVNRSAMKRHKSLPPRERRKTGVGFVEGIVVTLLFLTVSILLETLTIKCFIIRCRVPRAKKSEQTKGNLLLRRRSRD